MARLGEAEKSLVVKNGQTLQTGELKTGFPGLARVHCELENLGVVRVRGMVQERH